MKLLQSVKWWMVSIVVLNIKSDGAVPFFEVMNDYTDGNTDRVC